MGNNERRVKQGGPWTAENSLTQRPLVGLTTGLIEVHTGKDKSNQFQICAFDVQGESSWYKIKAAHANTARRKKNSLKAGKIQSHTWKTRRKARGLKKMQSSVRDKTSISMLADESTWD